MAALVLLLVVCFKSQILTTLAAPLIVEGSASFSAPVVLLHQSKPFFDETAALYRAAIAPQILVIQKPLSRSELLGAYGPGDRSTVRLSLRGIPEELLANIWCKDRRAWAFATALRTWLIEHPRSRLILLCERFESRRARLILDRVLDAEDRDRAFVVPVRDPLFDETSWWKRKEGQLALFNNYTALIYSYFNGDSGSTESDLNPAEYRTLLRADK